MSAFTSSIIFYLTSPRKAPASAPALKTSKHPSERECAVIEVPVIFSGLDGPLTALQDTYVVTVVLKSFMMDVLNASPLQVPVFKRSAVGPAFWGVRSLSACDGLDYANILNSQQAGRSITLDQPKLDDFACGSCGCGAFFRAARLECQRFSHACSSAHNIQ